MLCMNVIVDMLIIVSYEWEIKQQYYIFWVSIEMQYVLEQSFTSEKHLQNAKNIYIHLAYW